MRPAHPFSIRADYLGTPFAKWANGREVSMVPFVSVIGCLLIAVGVWGSVMNLRGDRPRF